MGENGILLDQTPDPVDPRVHIELDRLNSATAEINRLELALSEARVTFRRLLCDSTKRLDELRDRLGSLSSGCVERAQPYYEARFGAHEALRHNQVAATRYEKANSAHSAAREMVFLAEQGLGGRTLDPAWQEMLNHATQRVNDAEKERVSAESEHKIACLKHEASNAKVKQLQKELKRAIAKSSLSTRRSFLQLSSIISRHELMLLPYYEMKAQFNNLLDQQRNRVSSLENQVQTSKLTYADALRNLEQISDEIHQSRNSVQLQQQHLNTNSVTTIADRQTSFDSTGSSYVDDFSDEFKSLPPKLMQTLATTNVETVDGYRNLAINHSHNGGENCMLRSSNSNEWTEINLDVSSSEEEKEENGVFSSVGGHSQTYQKLVRQATMPNSRTDNEIAAETSLGKLKVEKSTISNWISRSSAKAEPDTTTSNNSSRRQSLDNILGPTHEKMKEFFSHGIMMLNISSLTDRQKADAKSSDGKASKKLPSPLEKTLTYLNADDDNSDSESLSGLDMLNDEQISSLMLDKTIGTVCEQVLGSPIEEVVQFPKESQSSSHDADKT